ncbi:MAG: MarR family transcriptional regulator [Clostridia bacterium]|nr:MarR family transcriptional regulator [Clostridia bacterium]
MIRDEDLMKSLMRSAACARRHPRQESEKGKRHCHSHRGFGHILDQLTKQDGIPQQTLADTVGIRPQSLSEAVAAMEQRGWIRRESSLTDRRAMAIYITEEGRLQQKRISEERRLRAKNFFAPLSDEEKDTLSSLLERLCRACVENENDPSFGEKEENQ